MGDRRSPMESREFSFRTRQAALQRFREETFDFLVIGGGITGAAVARDAASRGLRVALVERGDLASGTSSSSSKLIHGGLRYLENGELSLVFEALGERSLLLRTAPHLVRPLPFYFPVYRGGPHGAVKLGLGMVLYDVLALFRTPGFHKQISRRRMAREIPGLNPEGLQGGFRYFDASVWDDVLTVEVARAASGDGAAIATYVEAVSPVWNGGRICGFRVKDRLEKRPGEEMTIRAERVIVCAGPWTDTVGARLEDTWKPWLQPSKGVHLVFALDRIPLRGALVMSHPRDGRIAFAMPRPDLGPGVTIVGTTDAPSGPDPDTARVCDGDVEYLMDLLRQYFPGLELQRSDILSAYVGVRPLAGSAAGGRGEGSTLQKISREHMIAEGPGGTVIVTGGKFTTHRRMAEEAVDFTLELWRTDRRRRKAGPLSRRPGPTRTLRPPNPRALPAAVERARRRAHRRGLDIPEKLFERYGAEAVEVKDLTGAASEIDDDPSGFPCLEGQLRFQIRHGMVMRLEDFVLRRTALFASRGDHGAPWWPRLAEVWAEERGLGKAEAVAELDVLRKEIARREEWKSGCVDD